MKNAVIFTLIIVVGFMVFALLYQPKRIESEEKKYRITIYPSSFAEIHTFLVNEDTGQTFMLKYVKDIKDTRIYYWSPIESEHPFSKIKILQKAE